MKIVHRHVMLLIVLFLWGADVKAQIAGGTYNVPGNYNTLAEAVTALNTQGVSGHVVINMLPGNPETAPAGGYQLGSATLNASVASNRTITIRGNGNMITAQQCVGCVAATIRGIFLIVGLDYLTIDSLNLQENALNTSVNTKMNWGYALVKLNASDGCHNVTIRKCAITMDLAQTNALGAGIYAGNHLVTATTAQTITALSGTHSNNQFTQNVITARRGVLMNGFNAPVASRPSLFDQNNVISNNTFHFGINSANTSYITAGVHVQYQHKLQVLNNRFDNLDGANVIGNAPIHAVYFNLTEHADFTCEGNVFELSQDHATNVTYGVSSFIKGKGTVIIRNNIFRDFKFSNANGNSGAAAFIFQNHVVYNLIVTNNEFVNNTGMMKSNAFYAIRYNGTYEANMTDTSKGEITGNRLVNFEKVQRAASASQDNMHLFFVSIEATNHYLRGKFTISNNTVADVALSLGRFRGIGLGGLFTDGYGHDFELANNTFTRISGNGSYVDEIFASGGSGNSLVGRNIVIRDNVISHISRDGGRFRAMVVGSAQEDYDSWLSPLPEPYPSTLAYIYNNLITDVSVINSVDELNHGGVTGIRIIGGTNYIYNNFLSDLSHNLTVTGIDISTYYGVGPLTTVLHHPKNYIYNNTIKLGGVAPLSGVGVIGIVYSLRNDTTVIRNNIININALAGSFNHVACIKGTYAYMTNDGNHVIGAPGTSPHDGLTLNNNIYYASAATNTFIYVEDSTNNVGNTFLRNGFGIGGIVENPARYIFNDAGFNSACSGYKPFIGSGREMVSFWENNLVPASMAGTYMPTGSSYAKGNGVSVTVPPITTDFAGVSRGATPDVGALQFTGSLPANVPPLITITQPMPLITYCTDAASVNAHITAAGGLNTTTGTAPRLYYKKASETNAFGNYPAQNNASFDGWKYVEAIGTPPNFVFNIDYSKLHTPITVGDSITYFVVAQDNASVPNVAVNMAGFSSGCNLPSVNLDPSIGSTTAVPVSRGYRILQLPTLTATAGQAQYCMNGVAHIRLASLPQAAVVQWQEDRGTGATWFDIPGAHGIDYVTGTLIANNNYRAVVRCNGVVVATSNEVPIVIYSTLPPTSVTPGNRCGAGAVTLRAASPGNSLVWYEALTGGASMHRGDSFVTPSLSASKDYYVAAYNTLVSGSHIGIPAPTGSFSSSLANAGLMFDVLNPFILDSVTIYPTVGSLGDIYIKLVDSGGNVLQTKTLNASPLYLNAPNKVHLGFHIPPGVNHRLVMDGPSGSIPNFRMIPNAGFPSETQGIVTIKGGVINVQNWYYFFDWVISVGCESPTRTPVRATISPAPVISISATNSIICNGDATTLTVTSGNAGYTYQWTPGNHSGSTLTVSPSANTTYYVEATDNTNGVFRGCANLDSITITVNPSPVSFFNHNGNTTFCYGADSVQLEAAGNAGSYQWQRNGSNIPGAVTQSYMASDSGSYRLIMQDGACADTSGELVLTVYSLPVPVIVMNGSELTTDKPYNSYQWYWNGQLIPGATSATYNVIQDGKYSVHVEDGNNCVGISAEHPFALSVNDGSSFVAKRINIYPNPASTVVHINAPYPVRVAVTSLDGKTVVAGTETGQINIEHLSDGVYMIRVEDRNGVLVGMEKLVKIMR